MTMKKKLTVTTLAASMMFASIAGLPLSENGLANKLGITAGVASATTPTIQDKLNGLRDELAKDTDGVAAVRTTRDAIAAHTFTDLEMQTLLGDIWTDIDANVDVNVEPIFELLNGLDLFYDQSGEAIDSLLNNTDIRAAINVIFQAIPDGRSLTKADVVAFQEASLNALKDKQAQLLGSVASAFLLGGTSEDIKEALSDIVKKNVLNKEDLLISKFLNHYTISLGDLNAFQNRVANFFGDDAKLARTAIESAGIRYLLKDDFVFTDEDASSSIINPKLSIYSNSLNPYITWSKQSVTGAKFESGKLVLDGGTSGSGVLQARDTLFGLLLYISDELTVSQSSTTPSSEKNDVPSEDPSKNAIDALNKVADQLKGASEEKKAEILKQAQEAVANAILKLATIDLKSAVKVEGDTAKPTLNVTELTNKMKDIAAKAKELNDKLKQLNPNAKPEKIELKLDFGTTTAKKTEIPFAKDLLKSATENGIDSVAVSMNGLTLGVSPTEFSGDTTLKVTNEDKSKATDVTDLKIASDVYNFEFTSDGNEISTFTKPVTLQIPIAATTDVDTDLLTLAKIINGKLEYYGGRYGNGSFNAQRNGFSTYTVVENKVEFGDTSSVKAWAGRQIQVAAAKGILEGRAAGSFEPNGQVTRAEFAKMIVKTFFLEDATATESFTDVNDSDWYKVYVASAVKNGIVNGKEAGKFDPNGNITRAEMAVMSSRALALKGISLSPAKVEDALKGFTDVSAINASLKDGVALAASEGIVIGEEGNAFNPNANSTRAQAAVVIYRLLNK